MATASLPVQAGPFFVVGDTLNAYPYQTFGDDGDGRPPGLAAEASAVVDATGVATFAGLVGGRSYWIGTGTTPFKYLAATVPTPSPYVTLSTDSADAGKGVDFYTGAALTTLAITADPTGNKGSVNVTPTLTGANDVYKAAVRGNATIAAATGSSTFLNPSSFFGVKGYISGANLSGTANTLAGVHGIYNVTGTSASVLPKAGVIGVVGDTTTTADCAVMGYLDGDGGVTTARAAFGVMMQNSSGASGFQYGLDLQLQLVTGHETYSQAYKKADVRLQNGQEVYTGAETTRDAVRAAVGTQGAIGSLYCSSAGKMYLKVAAGDATTDWQRVTTTAAD